VILGLPVPGRNTIGRQAGIKPLALHISKRREPNHNQDCITESSRALNPSRALYKHTRIMHEMGTTTGNTTVTLRLKALVVQTLSRVKIQNITRRGH
jgi:hypothetical protein